MSVYDAIAALMTAWASCRDPALSVLSWPRYPVRELRPELADDGNVVLTVAKRGYGYKYRGPRPREPPVADIRGIREVLNMALDPAYRVVEVQDQGREILILIKTIKRRSQ